MFRPTAALLRLRATAAAAAAAKRVTVPRLSPTHTKARVVELLVKSGDRVSAYDPVFVLECSPDLVSEGFRENDDDGDGNERPKMIVETHDDGVVEFDFLEREEGPPMLGKDWLDVGTPLGRIVEEEGDGGGDAESDDAGGAGTADVVESESEFDGDWTWQAYKHDE